jgi:hypothetical protein
MKTNTDECWVPFMYYMNGKHLALIQVKRPCGMAKSIFIIETNAANGVKEGGFRKGRKEKFESIKAPLLSQQVVIKI